MHRSQIFQMMLGIYLVAVFLASPSKAPAYHPPSRLFAGVFIVDALYHARDALAASIGNSVPQPESGYLTGILVGAQGVVSKDMKDLFASTGTSHILAISGYNITIIAGVLASLLAPLGRRRSFWFSIGGIALFTLMVGASASVVRAAIMGIMALIGRQLGRQSSSATMILLSAAVMVGFDPLLLRWDLGFQLSFLALIGIIYMEPIFTRWLNSLIPWQWLSQMTATTLAATTMVLPLLLYDFGKLAIYTLPANLLVLPFVPVAMALGFATGVAGLIWSLAGQFIGQSAWLVAAYQLRVIKFFAGLPGATTSIHLSALAMGIAYAALAGGLILEYRKNSIVIPKENSHA